MNLWYRSYYIFISLIFISCQQTSFKPGRMTLDDKTYLEQRKKMVTEQLANRNIRDTRVLQAMEKIPRHLFIPEGYRKDAYEDHPVPIGFGQTISQPYIVALMTEVLQLKGGEKVLEIGTGSGYQAAVLAEMGAETYTIDIISELTAFATENLKQAGYPSVKVKTGDGYHGWDEFAPFDAVIVTCAPENVPKPLVEQLKEGGRMVIPVGPQNQVQDLFLMKKVKGEIIRQSIAPVRFVPMVGEIQKGR